MNRKSFLSEGNQALRRKQHALAMNLYLQAAQEHSELIGIIRENMRIAALSFRTDNGARELPKVAVCGWNPGCSIIDRPYALVELYEQFAKVELVCVSFPHEEEAVWRLISDDFPVISILQVVDNHDFLAQAVEFVSTRPYDLVHISKPLMSNIIIGMLFKLIWGAKVVLDLDDTVVTADSRETGRVPMPPDEKILLPDSLEVTINHEMAVNVVSKLDGITVANPVLQERFGGTVIWGESNERDKLAELEVAISEKTISFNSNCLKDSFSTINRNLHDYEPDLVAFLSRYGSLPEVFLNSEDQANQIKSIHLAGVGVGATENSRIFHQKLKTLEKSPDYSQDIAKKLQENEQKIAEELDGGSSGYQPLISVIMPNYNRADIIIESILSVLEQTYVNLELLICDDGSTDNSREVIEGLEDARIRYFYQEHRGAAAARNQAMAHAAGELITYLDTDNYWHPEYLMLVVTQFSKHPGRSALYFDYVDFHVAMDCLIHLKSTGRPDFVHENLIRQPFIDLNMFAHKKELYDLFGGFDETLTRRQDYDITLKYTWLRDPIHVKLIAGLYQRNDLLQQITKTRGKDKRCIPIINRKIERYFNYGLPVLLSLPIKKVTVITWNSCRSDFLKAFSVAEALSRRYDVELISFDFFDEGVFDPLKDVNPGFETKYFKGAKFPDFFATLNAAIETVSGDIMYVVRPCLPSLGFALIANYRHSIPLILEINDMEAVAGSMNVYDEDGEMLFADLDFTNTTLLNPNSDLWSKILAQISKQVPVLVVPDKSLDDHSGYRSHYMRNLTDERIYNPGLYDRDRIREELGFRKDDRIILVSGLSITPKAINELIELVEKLGDARYKLLLVSFRLSADQHTLLERFKETITVLVPEDRDEVARVNYAADLVIFWRNPDDAANNARIPYAVADALAMKTPIIASGFSESADLGQQGYLKNVPFGDWQVMMDTINDFFIDPMQTKQMCEAARRLYLRQFSYNAGITNFELAAYRVLHNGYESYPVADYFAEQFNLFYQAVAGTEDDFVSLRHSGQIN